MPEHPLLIVDVFNAVFGPPVRAAGEALGYEFYNPAQPIPFHIAIGFLILAAYTALGLFVRARLSVENPGKLQLAMEGLVKGFIALLQDWVGPKGPRFLPLIMTLGLFILTSNYLGMVPGFLAPTSTINTTLGCALTIWVYYHYQGVKEQGLWPYVKHFAAPPGAPLFIAPIMLPIEIISHLSRVLSLSLRLFGNVFGEELVIIILFGIIPFLVPLPMMFLGLITGGLQAVIFVLLSMVYLQGAVAVDHHGDEHGHDAPHGHAAPMAA
jgi:F-type H+-transporting ATPase subunit a